MSSWFVLLLAALVAVRLRCGSAEGDPLPPSLVELVRTSPISSIEDLQQLLDSDSQEQEGEEDKEGDHPHVTHGRYSRSLVEALPAQQASCKVRTEVMEVTRAMLDRGNANFLLWPLCVEVQRCSGCCNTRMLQCVPSVTHTRYLQVIKIQYINRNPHYEKVVISLEDHDTCRCQAASSSSSSSPTLPHHPVQRPPQNQPIPDPEASPPLGGPLTPHLHQPPPPGLQPKAAPPPHVKADLHRHDDLKHNQRFHLEEGDQLGRQWQGRYSTLAHTQPRQAYVLPPHTHSQGGVQPGNTHFVSNTHTSHGGVRPGVHTLTHTPPQTGRHALAQPQPEEPWVGGREVTPVPREGGPGSGFDGAHTSSSSSSSSSDSTGELHLSEHQLRQQQLLRYHQQQQQQHQQQQQQQQHSRGSIGAEPEQMTQYRHHTLQSDSASPPGSTTEIPNHNPGQDHSHSEPRIQKDSSIKATNRDGHRNSEEANQSQTETEVTNHKQANDKEATETTNGEGSYTDEERRKKLLEIVEGEPDGYTQVLLHPHPAEHHRPPHHVKTTTHKPVVVPSDAPLTPRPPRRPSGPQAAFRPALPRRRRKHRRRISKAALRAIIA